MMVLQFDEINRGDLLHVVGHRGGVSHELNSVLLHLSVATAEDDPDDPKKIMLAIPPEYVSQIVESLHRALSEYRQSN